MRVDNWEGGNGVELGWDEEEEENEDTTLVGVVPITSPWGRFLLDRLIEDWLWHSLTF